uniref:Uncharacterized protein n=1 Tax=Anguilla anguilla TaxID=7936 RepID=A0A0E9QVD6_ANGAN
MISVSSSVTSQMMTSSEISELFFKPLRLLTDPLLCSTGSSKMGWMNLGFFPLLFIRRGLLRFKLKTRLF